MLWKILALLCLAPPWPQTNGQLPEILRFGCLMDGEPGSPLETAFRHGINMVNDDRSLLMRSRLTENTDFAPDSFKASRKVCQMFETGIVSLFGPMNGVMAYHLKSMTNTFHVPYILTRWDYSRQKLDADFTVNIHPHPQKIGEAYADLITKLNWKSVTILYKDEKSLIKLQELIKLPKTYVGINVVIRQLYTHTDDYRPLFKEIRRSGETRIVLDCDFDKIEAILAQADEIGLINAYHSFLITSLDLERIDLSPYKYRDVNITGFRIADTSTPQAQLYLKKWNSVNRAGVGDFGGDASGYGGVRNDGRGIFHPFYSENVLMYDAVRMVAKALDEFGSIKSLEMNKLGCDRRSIWRGGAELIDYIRSAEYAGLTGEVMFDEDGYRTDFKMDLIEKQRDNMVPTGVWLPEIGVNFTTVGNMQLDGYIVEKLQNKTLRITTAENTPWIMQRQLPEGLTKEAKDRMSFEEKYEGYVIELVKLLAKKLKFKYKFHLVKDGKYGNIINEETKEWNGMVKELINQEADMAVIDMSINSDRQTAVDFTMPFMTTGVGILYKKKAPPDPNLFSFLSPLSIDVWMYMTTAYLATSILMFLLARISPYEWENPHPCDPDPDELETLFNLRNSLWFGIGSFLCQGSDILPKAISTRMVAGMWWFFTLIMISSYTANLAAFLTAAKMDAPINSAEDLAKQTKIKYGCMGDGATDAFFKGSSISTYQKLNAVMESTKPSVYTNNNGEGIDRVIKENGQYAFFMESASIDYYIERKCELTQIGGLLDSKGYGIAMPMDSPYTKTMTAGVLFLQESGALQQLKVKWWKEQNEGGKCEGSKSEDSNQLGLANLGGVFIVLAGGMVASCIIAVCEFVWKKRKLLVDENESVMSEMWQDFKFAIDLRQGDTKPVNPSASQSGSKSLLNQSQSQFGGSKNGGGSRKARSVINEENPYATFNED